MTHPQPVLVGVDGSPSGAAAVRYAAHEALARGTSLRLVHVVPEYRPIAPMMPLAPSDLTAAGREILQEATAAAREVLEQESVEPSLHHGPRVAALLEMADHAQLVVLGAGHRPLLERLFTGSTLLGVAARAACPVVAVPGGSASPERHDRILVGVKSTEHAAEIVGRALEIAAARSASVLLVHAWELPGLYDDLVTARVDKAEWADRARDAIERGVAGLRAARPEVPVDIEVVHGQPARVLEVASRDADLLLLARRHSGFPIGHLGGTGRALLHEAHCPVEVVPSGDPTEGADGRE